MKVAILCHSITKELLLNILEKHNNDEVELYVADYYWREAKRLFKGLNVNLKYHYEFATKYDYIYILDKDYFKDYLYSYTPNLMIYDGDKFTKMAKMSEKKENESIKTDEYKPADEKIKTKTKNKKE